LPEHAGMEKEQFGFFWKQNSSSDQLTKWPYLLRRIS